MPKETATLRFKYGMIVDEEDTVFFKITGTGFDVDKPGSEDFVAALMQVVAITQYVPPRIICMNYKTYSSHSPEKNWKSLSSPPQYPTYFLTLRFATFQIGSLVV